MKIQYILILFLICGSGKVFGQAKSLNDLTKLPLDSISKIETIAFGSCNNQEKKQSMWKYICRNQPDLWVWLGDNIYGDTEDMGLMASKYKKQKSAPGYRLLQSMTGILGIWDDHDYGVNDGDKNFPRKIESKNLMLDFLDVPFDAEVRKREGAYQSYTFGEEGRKVKIILLDARYFRDELVKDTISNQRYFPNRSGDILGEVQWQWLEKELTNSDAQLHLIGSGIQILPEEHFYEKWANFPKARTRFLDLLVKTGVQNAMLITGDRHIAEVSRIQLQNLDYVLYEVTASGLTHTWTKWTNEPNKWRKGEMIAKKNFGLLKIDWSSKQPIVKVEVRGDDNDLYLEETIDFNQK